MVIDIFCSLIYPLSLMGYLQSNYERVSNLNNLNRHKQLILGEFYFKTQAI